jgi:hypothetical protein
MKNINDTTEYAQTVIVGEELLLGCVPIVSLLHVMARHIST